MRSACSTVILLALLLGGTGAARLTAEERDGGVRRVVSVAPNLTEICFALGAGDLLVGVTRYCDHPPEAKEVRVIGGFLDPSYETILSLRPDLVLVLESNSGPAKQLRRLGLETLVVRDESLDDIFEMITKVGDALGRGKAATQMVEDMRARIRKVAHRTAEADRPTTVLCFNREQSRGRLDWVYVAAEGSLFDELLKLAGGKQAVPARGVLYPQLSAEGLLSLEPEVIVELVGDMPDEELRAAREDWGRLIDQGIVRAERVEVIRGLYAMRPGPRTVDLLEQLAECLHPELDFHPEQEAANGR